MTNYKGEKRAITTGRQGQVIPIHDGHEIIQLVENVDGSNAADGMLENNTGVIYQVAAGKTFRILGVHVRVGTAAAVSTLVISSGDTENAETATLLTLQIPNSGSALTFFAVDKTLAATKFLTINPSNTEISFIQIIGYEY